MDYQKILKQTKHYLFFQNYCSQIASQHAKGVCMPLIHISLKEYTEMGSVTPKKPKPQDPF